MRIYIDVNYCTTQTVPWYYETILRLIRALKYIRQTVTCGHDDVTVGLLLDCASGADRHQLVTFQLSPPCPQDGSAALYSAKASRCAQPSTARRRAASEEEGQRCMH